jgi:hypothetical protein
MALLVLFVVVLYPRAKADPLPSVSFSQDFPGSDPEHYTITVFADGHSSYQSDGKLVAQEQPGTEERFDFVLSPAATKQIFDLAKRAHYFSGNLDSRKKIAATGVKTLSYREGGKQTSATFNYSTISGVEPLTELFQSLSSTLEFGRRLQYYYRHQKLGLNEELGRMEEALNSHQLGDLSTVGPILQEIAQDPSVMNVARARAMRIAARR